jgi:hypothetical protein
LFAESAEFKEESLFNLLLRGEFILLCTVLLHGCPVPPLPLEEASDLTALLTEGFKVETNCNCEQAVVALRANTLLLCIVLLACVEFGFVGFAFAANLW